MSRPDDPYDNAFAESYWSRLKAELMEDGAFLTLDDARIESGEYIDNYYNGTGHPDDPASLSSGLPEPGAVRGST
jgi:Integrase core domain